MNEKFTDLVGKLMFGKKVYGYGFMSPVDIRELYRVWSEMNCGYSPDFINGNVKKVLDKFGIPTKECGTGWIVKNTIDYAIYYIPKKDETLMLYYGTGDNLWQEDIDAGYNDYMNTYWYKGKVTEEEFIEKNGDWDDGSYDGGMFMFHNGKLDRKDIVNAVLKDWYNAYVDAQFIGNAE